MEKEKLIIIEIMKVKEAYFEHHSKAETYFIPEFEAVKKINETDLED